MSEQSVQFNRIVYNPKNNKIDLWWTCDGTRMHDTHDGILSYYVPDATGKSEWTDINGNPVIKKNASNYYELKDLVDKLYPNIHGADLPQEHIFLQDYFEKTKLSCDMSNINVCYYDIETAAEDEFTTPEEAKYPINLITAEFTGSGRIVTWGLYDYTGSSSTVKEYRYFKNEAAMLEDFITIFRKEQVDIISGYNIDSFDTMYFINRCKRLGVEKSLSPVNQYKQNKYGEYEIVGISSLDYIKLYRDKFEFSTKESYALQAVAEAELGEGKLEYEGTISDQWKNNWNEHVEYNIQDVLLIKKLEKKKKYIELSVNIAFQALIPFHKVFSTIAMHHGMISNYLLKRKMVMPCRNKNITDDRSIPGGYVYAKPGLYKWVINFDAMSLYPTLIMQYNIGPETIRLNSDNPSLQRTPLSDSETKHETADGIITWGGISYDKTKESVTSLVVRNIFDERKKFKALQSLCVKTNDGMLNTSLLNSDEINLLEEIRRDNGNADYYDKQQHIRKIMINCFHKETDIITADGIKNIADVKVGDLVYSINPNNKVVELKPITHIANQFYNGNMIRFKTVRADVCVTPEHRMLNIIDNNIEIIKAEDTQKLHSFVAPLHNGIVESKSGLINICNYIDDEKLLDYNFFIYDESAKYKKNKIVKLGTLTKDKIEELFKSGIMLYAKNKRDYKCNTNKVFLDIENLSKLVGYYLSEGHIYTSKKKNGRGITNIISIAQDMFINPNIYLDIKNIIADISISLKTAYNYGDSPFSEKYRTTNDNISFSSDMIVSLLRDSFGQKYSKHIYGSKLIEELNEYLIYEKMYAGDGTKRGNIYTIGVKYDQLFQDTIKLYIRLGYIPRYRRETGKYDCYRIIRQEHNQHFKKDNINYSEEYNDYVYCVTVADNHTVLVGSNGKFSWTGQSLYGALGNSYFNFYNPDNAACITLSGQHFVKYCAQCFNDYFNKKYNLSDNIVCLIDTDSNYLQLDELIKNCGVTFENDAEACDWIENFINTEVNPYINKFVKAYSKFYDAPNIMNFRHEKIIKNMFISGKKQYAMDIVSDDGKRYVGEDGPKHKVMGIATKKTDSSKFLRSAGTEFLKRLLKGGTEEELNEYYREMFKNFKNSSVEDIAIPGKVNEYTKYFPKDISHYIKSKSISIPLKTPYRAKAAFYYNYFIKKHGCHLMPIMNGSKINLVYVDNMNELKCGAIAFMGSYPDDLRKAFKPDYDKMWEGIETKIASWFAVLGYGHPQKIRNTFNSFFS